MDRTDVKKINWFLIREAWSIENKAGEFDKSFGCNNNVYFNIQNGTSPDSKIFKKVSNITGIRKEILEGYELLEVQGVSLQEWEKYIKLLKQRAPGKDKSSKQAIEDKITEFRNGTENKVIGELSNAKEGSDWHYIKWFCEHKVKFTGVSPDRIIDYLTKNLNKVTWDTIKNLEGEGLYDGYKKALKEQYELLEAFRIYNKYK